MGNYNLISSSQELIGHFETGYIWEKGEVTMFKVEKVTVISGRKYYLGVHHFYYECDFS